MAVNLVVCPPKKKRRSSRKPTTRRQPPVPTPNNQEDDAQILMPVQTVVKGRWRIEKQLAKGAFGQISVARDFQTNQSVAVKAEAIHAPMTFLRMEVAVLRALQTKTRQVPRFFACGHTSEVNYLIMQLLGPSIMELKKKTVEDQFSIGTAIRIADRVLTALRDLHDSGYIHRDVKPSNFVIGSTKSDLRMIYMLDFGLCRQFIDPITGKQRPPRMRCGFRGTVRYACIDTLKSLDVGRDGDLWSLFYVLIEMLNGQLPWRRVVEKQEALEWKQSVSAMCLLPMELTELRELAEHIQSLDYYSRPDYDRMRRVFSKILTRFQVTEDTPMDWETRTPHERDHAEDAKQEKRESGKSEAVGDGEESMATERALNDIDG